MMFPRKAFSMVEIMVAIAIFGLAVLPLIWLGTNQTKNAYSASKHLMAGQLAASYMDNLLKRSYDELITLKDVPKTKVLDSPPSNYEKMFDLQELINGLEENTEYRSGSAKNNMNTSFKNFKYSITIKKDDSASKKVAIIDVEVYYNVIEGNDKTEQSVKLSALKFGEKSE